MSIFTGKQGYNSTDSWRERSERALREGGKLYAYDVGETEKDTTIPWLKSKLAELPTNPDVLEIGAGFGKWAEALKGLYASFTGVDVTLARIEHAKKIRGGPNVSFHHIPTPDWNLGRKFPVVLSITVIQHLLMPQAIDVLKGIERHLAPGGTAILAEGRIYDITLAEAEARYRDSANAAHMIPKPLALLKEAVPELRWYQESGGKFLLTRN